MPTLTGLDVLQRSDFARLSGKSIGLVCNQASLARDCRHVIELVLRHHREGLLNLAAVFGPQHGLFGHTQDNMIEWEGAPDPRIGVPIVSLYGEHREPTDRMLENVDLMVVDLPDVGARYYTFIWTMALCMKACERLGIPVLVLDRPNPISGVGVGGTVLEQELDSFVGLYPLPMRHGMTIGEIARYLANRFFPRIRLEVVEMEGWEREMFFDETGLPWAMPSPNMPTLDTAIVYPGGCLIEGTRLSEGRGTTRPFEIFGAPFIDAWEFCGNMNALGLPGVYFRPIQFEPTFHKFVGQVCEGATLHVLDRRVFDSVVTMVAAFQEIVRLYGDRFEWRPAPYEYEWEKEPIDILAGNTWLRPAVEHLEPLWQIAERMAAECAAFDPWRDTALLYA